VNVFPDWSNVVNGQQHLVDGVLVAPPSPISHQMFIGIPGVGRFWLLADGTYRADSPPNCSYPREEKK